MTRKRAGKAATSGKPTMAGQAALDENLTPKQQELLEAALRVMSRKGYEGSRTREIAQEAGVSEATLFKHFPTKRHILLALAQPFWASVVKPIMLASVKELVQAHKGRPVEETLREIARDRVALFRAHAPLITTFCLEAIRQPDLMALFRARVTPEITDVLGSIYDAARERGEIRDLDRRLFMRGFMSLVIGYLLLGGFFPEALGAGDDAAAVNGIMDLFLHGVERRADRQ